MSLEVVILAAGQGSRMRSSLPKVLHLLAGKPLLAHVIDSAQQLSPTAIHVVVGHGAEQVRSVFGEQALFWIEQRQQLGTGHAVLQALPAIGEGSTVLVLYGDVPLVSPGILQALVAAAAGAPALLTATLEDPAGYGRVLRDADGAFMAVVEHKDATDSERGVREVNTGILAAPASLLHRYLPSVDNSNQQQEYYLPDVLSLAVADGVPVQTASAANPLEVMGVNDQLQLSRLERELQRQRAEALMQAGVRLADPARIDIRGSLQCGQDVFIDVNCVFAGEVVLGDGVSIGPNCVLQDATVGEGSEICAMSHLESASVGSACNVGPYARLRPGTRLGDQARVGNFVETKKANIGVGSKVNHLSYVGDCEMGAGVNVGAGTITCNYDGVNKHITRIGDGAFVGSNATLVAPVEIGADGFVAAGSTITRPVATGELAVGRGKQRNIQGWTRPGKTDKD
ncbi:bifunctional UDP-N-acetylglucosamine diphosphorylase/glucosamine-1-phosphate N-acetyltransferase GlmU [Haliea sp. E1-2-M8]|uniref:bifunctional UDP-N-acetylglucosamine diphosphorylase/glucosamine-1-phosphate N-acetyltransferase GlmU n=1 Tax=Haliea sp. E1-2-M8 TaxID=3064706 RepID=UPI0027280452|nr:bifunctional UDP-N-acetylglucosamine diphosphorylase/glucosamine-1-phosphate N-acetyltransferase GlmU [Haliea sp. E1-2-M8]MDO8860122.1 bifunctional UDP-N-acetylglucosamine diphosphorylase/glucosamine-1-phosphate N-acetyltransferase GlmU [Haliea sp. E1-2-M8]